MKKIVFPFLVFILLAGLSFSQSTTPSKIEKVTLFTNQAQVKRVGQATIEEGLSEILIEVDAARIDSDSVTAKVFGQGEIYSVQLREVPLKAAPQKKISELEEKIQDLGDQRKATQNAILVLNKKGKFINSLVDFAQVEIPKEVKTDFPNLDDLEKTLSFLDSNLAQINTKTQNLTIEIRELNKEIDFLQRELAALTKQRPKSKKVIEILFNSAKKQQVKVEASYLVYNAYWQSFYKADVALDLKDVDLTMFSKIKQKTGEDWKAITLNISNVIPLRGVSLPELNSWYLYEESLRSDMKRRVIKTADNLGGSYAPEGMALEEAEFAQAKAKQLPLSFEYELPQTLDIESQDKETILPLFSKTLKGEFFHYAVPKMSALTFLVCKTASDKEILAGYLNVYFGGRFIGKTYLKEKRADEDFYLNLGADREVKVKKEKIKDKIDETFFGKIERQTIVRNIAYKISIENLKSKPVKVKLFDNIPVSKTDKVVIKDVRISPRPAEKNYQDKEGVDLWEIKVEPRGKKEINIEFTVTYPKDYPVLGL